MVVNKLKNGKYVTRVSYRDSNGEVRVKEKRFALRREALDFETDFRRYLESIKHGKLSLQQLLEEQLKIDKQHNTEKSNQEKRYSIETYCKNYLDTDVIDISKQDYLSIWQGIVDTDYQIATKNKAIKYVKGLAKFGEDFFDYRNNARHLQLLKKTSENIRQDQVWTTDDFLTFIEQVDDYNMKLMFKILFYSGLRVGEAIALLKTDLSSGSLSISKSMESYAKGFKTLKTVNSIRTVQLPTSLSKELTLTLDGDGEFLIGGKRPLSRSTIQRHFEAAIDKVNEIDTNDEDIKELRIKKENPKLKYIRIHDLRHSHATILLDKGANVVSVSRRLGHASIQITIDTYTHVLKKQEEKILEILDKL